MRKLFKNRFVKYGVIFAVILIAVFLIVSAIIGAGEITLLNSKSLTDWKLGGTVEGISSPEEGEAAVIIPYRWFDEDGKMGLRNEATGTTYYMGKYPSSTAGKFCVTGFVSAEKAYSILGIRTGTPEEDAKSILLRNGYVLVAGGMNSCRAERGNVTIELLFQHGSVIRISAFINK